MSGTPFLFCVLSQIRVVDLITRQCHLQSRIPNRTLSILDPWPVVCSSLVYGTLGAIGPFNPLIGKIAQESKS